MRKLLIVGIVIAAGAAVYFAVIRREQPAAAAEQGQNAQGQGRGNPGGGPGGGGFGGGGFGGPGGGGGFRPPMTVEMAKVQRGKISSFLTVVGNLVGDQTVEVVPRTGGRVTSISVKLGDRVRRNQVVAKIEDREIVEQVNQAQASHKVAEATIRQRQADLELAKTSVERSRNLYGRQLLPKQTLDDAEARYSAAQAQVDLAYAQLAQSASRLQELQINLGNTNVVSPVDGFVAKRNVDPGAWVSNQAGVASVVDISSLRLVANIVEKDLRLVSAGDPAVVEVDAFPGEKFNGKIARVSPILDPATRTAPMEIEIPNANFRLKPGMYAKVTLEVDSKDNVLLIPKVALVDSEGQRGVFQPNNDSRAAFKPIKIGIEDAERVEVLDGLAEGEMVVSTGAGALRRNDQLVTAGGSAGPGGPGAGRGGQGQGQGRGRRGGQGGEGGRGGGQGGQGAGGQGAPGRPSQDGAAADSQPAQPQPVPLKQQRPVA
jgi:membrane fusion protein (multidrug efflux system)